MADTRVDVQGMYHKSLSMLYVGEGDFSFSSFFATWFGVASNIVATSLDSTGDLMKKYGVDAILNITNLRNRGAHVIHSVDVFNMGEKDGTLLLASERSHFDAVNFNFPHAGFFGKEDGPEMIRKHTELMQGFFANAAQLLAPGGVVYVAHKCGPPYDSWNLKENADKHGLEFIGSVPFQKSNFPGYKNRKGSGYSAGDTFALGEAAIYVFALRCKAWIEKMGEHRLHIPDIEQYLLQTLSNLRLYTEGGRASLKTPLLPAIEAEVSCLENKELGPEKQIKLNTLKLVSKVVPLLVKSLAIHQIHGFHPARTYKYLEQSWSRIQKLAREAMQANALGVRVSGSGRYDGTAGGPSPVGGDLMPYSDFASHRHVHPGPHDAPGASRGRPHLGAPQARYRAPARHPMFICKCCGEDVARQSDETTEGAIGAHVKAHRYVLETLMSLSCARNMRLEGAPHLAENNWFPGYAMILARCQGCYVKGLLQSMMGWQFIATHPETRPQTFWGIRRTMLIGSSEFQPLGDVCWG